MKLKPCPNCKEMLTTRNVFQVLRTKNFGPDALIVTHNRPGCFSTSVLLKLADRVALVFERANKKKAA